MKLMRTVWLRWTGVALLAMAVADLGTGCSPQAVPDDPQVLKLTKANFQAEVLEAKQAVLVDFWAPWCGPCRVVGPMVAELAGEFAGRASVGKVNVDTETALAQEYKIAAIPAFLIFKDGQVVDQIIGARSKADLKARFEKFVTGAAPAAAPKS